MTNMAMKINEIPEGMDNKLNTSVQPMMRSVWNDYIGDQEIGELSPGVYTMHSIKEVIQGVNKYSWYFLCCITFD